MGLSTYHFVLIIVGTIILTSSTAFQGTMGANSEAVWPIKYKSEVQNCTLDNLGSPCVKYRCTQGENIRSCCMLASGSPNTATCCCISTTDCSLVKNQTCPPPQKSDKSNSGISDFDA